MRALLLIHLSLLLLASTAFTVVTSLTSGESLHWEYFTYRSTGGFGIPYVSPYSLAVVSTYCFAFACGAVAYWLALSRGMKLLGTVGVTLCLVGLMSFLFEGSHWLLSHNRSWLAYSPGLMFVLAVVCLFRSRSQLIQPRLEQLTAS